MSFHGPDGTHCTDPLQLTGRRPVVDLAALGLLFAPPALFGEFYPASPWSGISLQPATFGGATSVAPPRVAFPAAVSTLIADTEVVAVKFSGGIDSLAVLAQVCRAGSSGRRVVAVTVDLVDDDGVHAADTARRLVHGLGLDCELVVIDPARCRPEISAPWSPVGPRLDALPQFNALVAEAAHTAGAGVLLSGDGADEVLEVPPFATTAIASARGLRAAARYVADMSGRGGGLLVELAAAAAPALPSAARARAYWALSWQDTLGQPASPVLADPFRGIAAEWASAWCTARTEGHIAGGGSWADQAAWDAVWPHDRLLPAGAVAEDSPFLAEAVLAAAQQLGAADRFDPGLPTPYQRCKAAVVELFEPAQRPWLPRHKQYFRHALARLTRGRTTTAERAIAAGLIDPDAWAANTDLAVTMMVAAVEDWLTGADAIGAHIPGVSP
ncbi:asparagine synthase-related protein [Pseudonocardia sp. KRD291]|uniref:asparagine synthase-related protein n=1 Tax=Pseudonocardia sp. KRD291 TaxID=2792007 RepID=UPI001C4A6DBD|nr:asparagine synthase-related protein [Pseudonocardia sp. KRD291]MBW0101511.1 hypothetical protein [Pseudonocardia sp. KRD291]